MYPIQEGLSQARALCPPPAPPLLAGSFLPVPWGYYLHSLTASQLSPFTPALRLISSDSVSFI